MKLSLFILNNIVKKDLFTWLIVYTIRQKWGVTEMSNDYYHPPHFLETVNQWYINNQKITNSKNLSNE